MGLWRWLKGLFTKPKPIETIDFFPFAVAYTIANEGGYCDDKNDTPTNFGITQEDLVKWRKHPCTKDDVRLMHVNEAKMIYRKWYWDDISLSLVRNQAIATAIFDQGVLIGTRTAIGLAQYALNNCGGHMVVTGVLDDATAKGLCEVDTTSFLLAFCKILESHFEEIVRVKPAKKDFLRGWIKRASRLVNLAHP